MKMTSRHRSSPPRSPRAAALARIGAWLAAQRKQIRAQVVVRRGRRGGEERTSIEIDHLLQGATAGLGRIRVHTKKTFLPRAHFSSEARVCVSNAARSDSGRAIYCEDPEMGEVIAVIAFHLPREQRHPVLITTIALRDDIEGNPALGVRSISAGLALKHYVHAIAHLLGRGGHVDLDLAASGQLELMHELGFSRAPRVDGFRPGGTHLRQPSPATRPRARAGSR